MPKLSLILISLGIITMASAQAVRQPDLSIAHRLEGKNAHERANIKAEEISKLPLVGTYVNDPYGVRVEIRNMKKIEGGIEIFARAWKGTKQLGFGKDGSVEIERFLVYNPPILVDDPNGKIVREWTEEGVTKRRKLREAPTEAIRSTLAHTIHLVGKADGMIEKGKVGNTTSTYRPDAGNYVGTTVDGYSLYSSGGVTWASMISNTTGASFGDTATVTATRISAYGDADLWSILTRSFFHFNTSLPATGVVSSATLSLKVESLANTFSVNTFTLNAYQSTTANPHGLSNSDFDNVGSTAYSDSNILYSNLVDEEFFDISFNTTGKSAILFGGITKLALRDVTYDVGATSPTWEIGKEMTTKVYAADTAGTDSDPVLVVEWSIPAPPAVPEAVLRIM